MSDPAPAPGVLPRDGARGPNRVQGQTSLNSSPAAAEGDATSLMRFPMWVTRVRRGVRERRVGTAHRLPDLVPSIGRSNYLHHRSR